MTGGHRAANTSTARSVSVQVPLPVLAVLGDVRQAFHGLCISTGMQVLQAMQEADRDVLCGPKGRHQPEREAWRGGSVESHVTLGGRQVGLPRLRVRDAEGEVPLASFQWAAATDALESHTLEAIAAGVSTRQYARTLDPVPAEVSERSTSRSAVSRRIVALSTERLRAFVSRPLGELDLRVVCIDGKVFKEHCIVIALGIDTEGRKHVLGLREGATETAAVSKALLNDLVTRCCSSSTGRGRYDAPSATSTARSASYSAASSTSIGTCSVICRSGCTPASSERCARRGTCIRRRARNGLSSASPARSRTSIPAPRHPSARGWTRR